MHVTVHFGRPAFTPARLAKLLERVREANQGVTALAARFVHIVALKAPLSERSQAALERLLEYGPTMPWQPPQGNRLVVVPRLGTISPWSSKATDIARICGLVEIERIERGIEWHIAGSVTDEAKLRLLLHDRMTETVLDSLDEACRLFEHMRPRPLTTVPLDTLEEVNRAMGLALLPEEIDALRRIFGELGRDPTDVELTMFAQANSEHCRHKIFNAEFIVDGEPQTDSLFGMIRRSTEASPRGILSAYRDNAAVIEGFVADRFFPDPSTGIYAFHREPVHILMKVETHNHPTAISPYPGASTGSGGEIRDEAATGRGAKPKAGLVGFSVSNLRIPGAVQPWERDYGRPGRIASALDIMLEGPLGGAGFNNEFGRPALAGYFRTFELEVDGEVRGYHKPIMVAGGLGNIREDHVHKAEIPPGAAIIVLGGPALLIGLGGGAASSMAAGSSDEELDFASVQRDNPEMQRRCQEVIDRCWALGPDNPILSIHDVGAGGLSNALPELVHESGRGARLDLRKIPNDEPGMAPHEIWCNEAQERYVLAVLPERLPLFESLCARERCPFAVIGHATDDGRLVVEDPLFRNKPVDMPMASLFGKLPRKRRDTRRRIIQAPPFSTDGLDVREALLRVLMLPTVGDKTFLVTIGDRTVGGLVVRDQMVGPWQVPVSDVAVTASGFRATTGEAMAMGERAPVALLDAKASARLAVGEALTNIVAAPIASIGCVRLSANWMAAADHPGEDARLFDAVRAVGVELCPALGVAIPVGKDSLSMRTLWREGDSERAVIAPLSLIVSAFAPVTDVRRVLTPEIQRIPESTSLLLIDLGAGRNRLGASALAQVYGTIGNTPADLDDPALLRGFFAAVTELNLEGLLLAYHDRSDGGLIVTLLEMAFAGGVGLEIAVPVTHPIEHLFSEELGAVIQVRDKDLERVRAILAKHGLGGHTHAVARPISENRIVVRAGSEILLDEQRSFLRGVYAETTYRIQRLMDDPTCADEEQELRCDPNDPGLVLHLTFSPRENGRADSVGAACVTHRPRVAILREQGVNGHVEMAAAFDRAGFEAVDLHMSDILEGRRTLDDFVGLAACGGFSFGDVLGAGEGWAKSVLLSERARDVFACFFERKETFVLGICNGCQMLAALRELIPGASEWPRFVKNRSEQFEARLSLVRIEPSPSVLLRGMAGSIIPIAVAHGEGRAEFVSEAHLERLEAQGLVVARYVNGRGEIATRYPQNPNGSPRGITAVTTPDGRVTIMMPHPERVFRSLQLSYRPHGLKEDSPWMQLFHNARSFVG